MQCGNLSHAVISCAAHLTLRESIVKGVARKNGRIHVDLVQGYLHTWNSPTAIVPTSKGLHQAKVEVFSSIARTPIWIDLQVQAPGRGCRLHQQKNGWDDKEVVHFFVDTHKLSSVVSVAMIGILTFTVNCMGVKGSVLTHLL